MNKREWYGKIVFGCLLFMAFCGMFYYGHRKEGYHVDELYSYGLANSEYLPFMHFGEMEYSVKDWMLEYGAGENVFQLFRNLAKDVQILSKNHFRVKESLIYQDYQRAQANSADTRTTTWVPGQAYQDYLAASKDNRFNYASVYYNQRGDVHPPLFYMGLHTVSSLFPGRFSKWIALVPNILYMGLALWVFFRLIGKYLGGKWLALVTLAVFALSRNMVTTAIFLRMYALLTLMVLWCFSLHLELLEKNYRLDAKLGKKLLLSAFLGYMTHYYFVLYILAIAFVSAGIMVARKQWKALCRYGFNMMGAAILGLLIWPFSVKHVFLGYRGKDSLETLSSLHYSRWRFQVMLENLIRDMWGGHMGLAYGILAILIVLCLGTWVVTVMKRGRKIQLNDEVLPGEEEKKQDLAQIVENNVEENEGLEISKVILTILPVLFYVLLTSQIVPFLDARYAFCLYPFLCIIYVCGVAYLVRIVMGVLTESLWKKREVVRKGSVAVMGFLLLLFGNYVTHEPGFLFLGGQEKTVVPERTVCVYVLPDGDWNESANETNVLAKCEKVALVYESNLEVLRGTYSYEDEQTVMVVVHDSLDLEKVAGEVRDVLGIQDLAETGRMQQSNTHKILYRRQ